MLVAPVLKAGDTVILESTSPVGTTEAMRDIFAQLRPDLKIAKCIGFCWNEMKFHFILAKFLLKF